MTREEFEARYCARSNITRENYKEWFVSLPCACDYAGCQGWGAISNNPDMIRVHQELYAPLGATS